VGAGPGLPLERTDMRVGCQERAPRGPSVGAGPRVPLGRDDVRVRCRWRASRGPLVCAGPRVPRVPIGAPRMKKRVGWLPRTGTARSSSRRGPRAAPSTPTNTPSSTPKRTTPRSPKICEIIHDNAFWDLLLPSPPPHPSATACYKNLWISSSSSSSPATMAIRMNPPVRPGFYGSWFEGLRVLGF